MREMEIEKLKEMLKNTSVKYFNLEKGNLNNTDRIYFEKIRKYIQKMIINLIKSILNMKMHFKKYQMGIRK